jgi:hypothetical protein
LIVALQYIPVKKRWPPPAIWILEYSTASEKNIHRRAAKNAEIVFCLPLRGRKAKRNLAFVRADYTICLAVLGSRTATEEG